jgi:hypothetical protein
MVPMSQYYVELGGLDPSKKGVENRKWTIAKPPYNKTLLRM